MVTCFRLCAKRRSRAARAFTLVELLVVLAIITLLLAILLPSLGRAREGGRMVHCLSNLRQISIFNGIYMRQDETESPAWHVGPQYAGVFFSATTPFIYGGFQAPEAGSYPGTDADMLPTGLRPLNATVVKPSVIDRQPVPLYICPSDQGLPAVVPGDTTPQETGDPSWEYIGNSYAINWYWLEYFALRGDPTASFELSKMSRLGSRMLRRKVGGPASRFVLFYEGPMDALMYSARPDCSGNLPRVRGWHREFSKHSVAFLDGSASNLYVDTRCVYDSGGGRWTTWPEPGT